MSKWSKEQDELLREFGSRGPSECARLIYERFGVARTPQAVQRHAYRIGVSVIAFEVCPQCHRRTRRLGRAGLCPICDQRRLAEDQKAFNRELLAEIDGAQAAGDYAEARKDYAKARQATSRLCRKYGIRNKKERKYGDYAKCQNNLSKAWSDAEKNLRPTKPEAREQPRKQA